MLKAGRGQPRRWVAALSRFWADDRGLSIFSVLLLVVIFILPPLVPAGTGRSLAGDVLNALLLVAGVGGLADRRGTRLFLLPAACVAIAVDFGRLDPARAHALGPGHEPRLAARLPGGGPHPDPSRGSGHVPPYPGCDRGLPAAGSAVGPRLCPPDEPEAWRVRGALGAGDGARAFYYFSFVTLATVGYGDILPVHPVARSLAMLEAVTGSLYLTILVARLVSLSVPPRGDEGRHDSAGAEE